MHILPLPYNILRSVLLGGCCKILENYFSCLFYMLHASSYQIMECNNEASKQSTGLSKHLNMIKRNRVIAYKKVKSYIQKGGKCN